MKYEITISPDRENFLYENNENCVFTITVRRNNGTLVRSGDLKIHIGQDGGPDGVQLYRFDLASSGNPVQVQTQMSEPCFCLCQAWYENSYGETRVYYRNEQQIGDLIAFDLLKGAPLKAPLQTQVDDPARPRDFDSFWKKTLKKARELPWDMQLKKLDRYCRDDASYYSFSMNTLHGDRVHGFLGVPQGKGPFPVIALFPGKGPAGVKPVDCGWTACGCITVMFSVHKYEPASTPEESKKQMEQYAQDHNADDYWRVGIHETEQFHFYSVLPGFCHVLDYVCEHFSWDQRHLALAGSSQGGWMSLCMAYLYRKRVSAAYAGVPACGFLSRLNGSKLGKFPIPPYFEANYFAPGIKAPILVSTGLRDVSCPSLMVTGMFSLIGSREKTLETDNGEHLVTVQRQERERAFLLRALGVASAAEKRISRHNNELISVRGSMLQNYYLEKSKEQDLLRAKRLAAVKNEQDARDYMEEVRGKLKRIFGSMPPVAVMDPRVTGVVSTEKLCIEKVLFQSRKGYYVSALLYRPKNIRTSLPGVLFLCGHSLEGKLSPIYQRVPQSLALRGFCVLAVDPYGQGERKEFGGGAVTEHDRFGKRLALLGEFFGAWRLHDALTALEYLKSRPEVDNTRLGVTGCSGGGTMTAYVNAFSPDLCMAAPVCSMTRMGSNLENEIVADCEQNPPSFRAEGLDEDDFLLSYAPRPILLGVQDNDFFDARGSRKMYESMQTFYRIFGKEDQLRFSLGKGDHSYSVFHQQQVGEFFSAVTGAEAVGDDNDIVLFPKEELYCTENGSVWQLPDSCSTVQICRELLQKHPNSLLLEDPALLPVDVNVSQLKVPAYRLGFHQYAAPAKLQGNRFLIRTEPGIEVTLKQIGKNILYHLPESETAVIFLPEEDGFREMDLHDYEENQHNFFLLEVRGCGESLPCPPGCDMDQIYKPLYASWGRMMGKDLLQGQVLDILSTLKLLEHHGVKHVTLIAQGCMNIAASAAAVHSPVPVTLKRRKPPVSWKRFILDPGKDLPHEYCVFLGKKP